MEPSLIKVVVLGDSPSLKSSLLSYFQEENLDHQPVLFVNTIEAIIVDNSLVRLQLCDTSGQEPYDKIQILSYATADIVLIVFDVFDRKQFDRITQKVILDVKKFAPRAVIQLAATKDSNNETNKNQINKKELLHKTTALKCLYSYFSQQDRTSKEEVFKKSAKQYLKLRRRMCMSTPGCIGKQSNDNSECQLI